MPRRGAPPSIDYSQIHYDERGAPYWTNAQGGRVFLPPLSAAQTQDPRAQEWARGMGVWLERDDEGNVTGVHNQSAPGSSYLKERGHWNAEKGQWDQDTNWNNIMATAVGGLIAAPAVAGAIGASAGSGAAAGGGTAGGVLPSAAIPGMSTAVPGAIASQGVSAGIGAGAASAAGGAALPSASIPGLHAATPSTGSMASQGASQLSGGSSMWKNIGKRLLDYGLDYASDLGQVAGDAAKGSADQRLNEYYAQLARDRGLIERGRLDVDQRQGRDRMALDAVGLDINQRLGRDRNAIDTASLGVSQNTSRDAQALQRGQFGIDAAGARARQAAQGDAQANVQDVEISFAPTTGTLPQFNIKGGLRPSMFGANARNAGKELSRQALLALMTKSDVPTASKAIEMPGQSDLVAMPKQSDPAELPTLSPMTKAGLGEKVLGGVGLGGSILGALGQTLKRRPQTMAGRS